MAKKTAQEWAELYSKEIIQQYNPKFGIKYKRDSKLFKILRPIILLINPKFYTNYTTTLFGTVWIVDDYYKAFKRVPTDILETFAHEGLHEYDRNKKFPYIFDLIYCFPQVFFIIFSLISLLTLNIWWIIPAIICLAPLPAPGRYFLELRAYRMYKVFCKYYYRSDKETMDEWYTQTVLYQLSNIQTYWGCWPFKKQIIKDFSKPVEEFENERPYKDTVNFLKKYKLVV